MRARWLAVVVILALAGVSCADKKLPDETTDGDSGQSCKAGRLSCPCLAEDRCLEPLVCERGLCVNPHAEIGEEGGPCYSNKTCDRGLFCNAEDLCEAVEADGDGEPALDGDFVEADGDGADAGEGDSDPEPETQEQDAVPDGDASCEPPAGWPPDPNQVPWYQGKTCKLPACDDAVQNSCYDSSGTWKQTLTTLSHTCGSMVENFNPRLKPGHQEVVNGVVFHGIGECEYTDGVLTGVVKGDTGISCSVSTESDGFGGTITVVQTGVGRHKGSRIEGTARAFLFDLPMGTPDCYADFTLVFERE